LSGQPLISPDGHIQGAGQSFEESLGPMVVVSASQKPGVQVQPAFVGYALKKVGDERGTHLTDTLGAESAVEDKIAAPAKIHSYQGQSFVQRHNGVAHTGNALPVTQRLSQRPAQNNADILDGVVLINVQVACGLHLQIKASVPGQGVQHMIQKADAGGNFRPAGAIQIESHLYIRFARFAFNGSDAR
jgi:hypothetical protein